MKRNINKKIVKDNNYKTHVITKTSIIFPPHTTKNLNLVLLHFRHRAKALKKTKRKQTHPIPLDIRSINFRSINHPITLQRPNKLAHPCNSENRFTPLEDGSRTKASCSPVD